MNFVSVDEARRVNWDGRIQKADNGE